MVRFLACVVLGFAATASVAGTQRLGLAPTAKPVPIAPRSSRAMPSYCHDAYLKPPAAGTPLHLINTAATDAQVVLGGASYSLAQAVADGMVELQARGGIGGQGDYRSVSVVNKTDQPMTLMIGRVDVADASTRQGVGLLAISKGDAFGHDADRQQRIWANTLTALRQSVYDTVGQYPTIDDYIRDHREAGPLVTFVAEGGDRRVLVNDLVLGQPVAHLVRDGRIVPGHTLYGQRAIDRFERPEQVLCEEATTKSVVVVRPRLVAQGVTGGGDEPPPGMTGFPAIGFRVQIGSVWADLDADYCVRLLRGQTDERDAATDDRVRELLLGRAVVVARGVIARGTSVPPIGFVSLDPAELLVGLQRRFPAVRFGLDDPDKLPAAVLRLASLPAVNGAGDVTVLFDRHKGARELLMTAEPYLRAKIPGSVLELTKAVLDAFAVADPVARAAWERKLQAANLVIVSEHQDAAYREYVTALLRQGLLKGKVVALLTCYEPGGELFNSELLAGPDAPRAVVYLRRKVLHAETLARVLSRFADLLAAQPDGTAVNLRELLKAAATEAKRRHPALSDEDIDTIQHMTVIQVSDLGRTGGEVVYV